MFTGLIQEMGHITRVERQSGGLRWSIRCPKTAPLLKRGDSINISGACQTVETISGDTISGTSIPETLKKTTFSNWRAGHTVNLEPALRASDRLGGHMVSGHVDTVGTLRKRGMTGDWLTLSVEFENKFSRWVIPHGSIAIEGVSLTIAECARGTLTVALIPETIERTTLGSANPGDQLNLEFDQIIKAVVQTVEHLVSTGTTPMSFPSAAAEESILETLERAGY